MSRPARRTIEQLLAEYADFMDGAPCSAFERLAEALCQLQDQESPLAKRVFHEARRVFSNEKNVAILKSCIASSVDSVRFIARGARDYVEEEIMFAISNRVQVELLLRMIRDVLRLKMDVDLSAIDEGLVAVAKAPETSRDFRISVARMRANLDSPVDILRLLGLDRP
jgi:hypothetical protein